MYGRAVASHLSAPETPHQRQSKVRIGPAPQARPVFVPHCHFLSQRMANRFHVVSHQLHVAIRTAGKPLSILRFTPGTIHGAPGLSSPQGYTFSTLAKGTFRKGV